MKTIRDKNHRYDYSVIRKEILRMRDSGMFRDDAILIYLKSNGVDLRTGRFILRMIDEGR